MSQARKFIESYFLYFIFYSVIGWLYEVFLEVVVYRIGFSNRGVLFGPYCVVYGTGALLLLFALRGLQRRKILLGKINITPALIFLAIIAIATSLELLASYIMEWTTGNWMWDYTRFSFNFQGRIAPNPSIRFGLGGMVFLYVLQPFFEKIVNHLSPRKLDILSGIIGTVFFADVLVYLFK